MSLPLNPFELCDHLIKERYVLPLPVKTELLFKNANDNFISTIPNEENKVYLGELLEHLKIHIMKLQKENIELKKDLKTVLSNGSIKWFQDSYYNNGDAVEQSTDIHNKWFKNNSP